MSVAAGEPRRRALAAVEALDAEGVRVTARAVKDRARVQMETARAAAAEWNARTAAATTAPEVPESLTVRFTAIWEEAWRAARAEFDTERQGWTSRLEEADRDIDAVQDEADRSNDALRAELATTGQQRDQARLEADTLQQQLAAEQADHASRVEQLRDAIGVAEKAQARLEATIEAVSVERDELRRELAAARADWAALEARHLEQVTDLTGKHAHTQGALEATTAERDQLRADLTAARTR